MELIRPGFRSSSRRGVYTDRRARVLLAVIRQPRPTVTTIAKAIGVSSTAIVWWHLEALRRDGFVTWTDGRAGTLRATSREIPL